MRSTNIAAGAGKLQHDLKDLLAHWEGTREGWDDAVRRDFEERRIVPLRRAVEGAVRGMDELRSVLQRMAREVGPRD